MVQPFTGAGQHFEGTEKSMCVLVMLQRECIEYYGMAIPLFFLNLIYGQIAQKYALKLLWSINSQSVLVLSLFQNWIKT